MNSSSKPKKGRGTKAASPAIAHVIMAATIVSVGISVLYWSNGNFNSHKRQASTFFSTSTEAMKESLVIEDIWFYEDSGKYVNITVRNVGKVDLEVAHIYVNSERVWDDGQLIMMGEAVTIKAALSWEAGEHYIVVVTTRGNHVQEWYDV